MSPRPKKITPQGGLHEAIKATAWKQIAEAGAPALSLRAIARELDITAPAIYNYYPTRDDLVTALIIDAYRDLGDAQSAAVAAQPETDLKGQLLASGRAYRSWALHYPERYQLIFGTPIPGYTAPLEKTQPFAAGTFAGLVRILDALRRQGRLVVRAGLVETAAELAAFEQWKLVGLEADVQSAQVAMIVWARVHGLVSIEISGNMPPFGAAPAALYEYELESIAREFILSG